MTEDEAKTKWCPFAKRAPYASAREADEIAMRGIDPDYEREMAAQWPCIASACMAWRTSHTVRGEVVERITAAPLSTKPPGDEWGYEAIDPASAAKGGEWVRWATGVSHGFCGLAWAPR